MDENIRDNNPLSDKEILKNVAEAVNRSIIMLAEDIGEKQGTLYQVTTGRNNLSIKIRSKIIETYQNVNPDYVNCGTEPILIKDSNQNEDEFKVEIIMQLKRLNMKLDMISEVINELITSSSSTNGKFNF